MTSKAIHGLTLGETIGCKLWDCTVEQHHCKKCGTPASRDHFGKVASNYRFSKIGDRFSNCTPCREKLAEKARFNSRKRAEAAKSDQSKKRRRGDGASSFEEQAAKRRATEDKKDKVGGSPGERTQDELQLQYRQASAAFFGSHVDGGKRTLTMQRLGQLEDMAKEINLPATFQGPLALFAQRYQDAKTAGGSSSSLFSSSPATATAPLSSFFARLAAGKDWTASLLVDLYNVWLYRRQSWLRVRYLIEAPKNPDKDLQLAMQAELESLVFMNQLLVAGWEAPPQPLMSVVEDFLNKRGVQAEF